MGLGQAVFCLKISPAGGLSFQIGKKKCFLCFYLWNLEFKEKFDRFQAAKF
jgi:hypothetical protein